MTILRARWLTALLAAAMLAAACSSTPEDEAAAPATTAASPTTGTTAPDETAPVTTGSAPTETTEAADAAETTAPATTDDAEEPEVTEAEADESTAVAGERTPDDADDGASGLPDAKTGEADAEATAEDDPEAAETAEPSYENRSTGSVFPDNAYYDHDAIRALFPHCPPLDGGSLGEWAPWIGEVFDYWDETYKGWDTDSVPLAGRWIASGWWTDEQLDRFRPGAGITAASAREHAEYHSNIDYTTMWSGSNVPQGGAGNIYSYGPFLWADGTYTFENLYRRLASYGYVNSESERVNLSETLRVVRDSGLPGGDPNPPEVDVTMLLVEWTVTRYRHPPTMHEPAAWAMRSLLDARDPGCVAAQMRSVCDYDGDDMAGVIGEQAAELLDRNHRFGQVLWSLVCPEV